MNSFTPNIFFSWNFAFSFTFWAFCLFSFSFISILLIYLMNLATFSFAPLDLSIISEDITRGQIV